MVAVVGGGVFDGIMVDEKSCGVEVFGCTRLG